MGDRQEALQILRRHTLPSQLLQRHRRDRSTNVHQMQGHANESRGVERRIRVRVRHRILL